MGAQQWLPYEQVARELLNRFSDEFGLDRVEPKQSLPGASGTVWEIDAKGVSDGNVTGFLKDRSIFS